jgi:hypothetical protein
MHCTRPVGILRLLVTLMALSCAMAGPAAAMPAMKAAVAATLSQPLEAAAETAMPCHEAALAAVAGQIVEEGGSLIGKETAPAALHLCCVMATLVVTPLKPMMIADPSARFALLVPGAPETVSGRYVKMPTPPPRFS